MSVTITFKIMIICSLAPHFHVKLCLSSTCNMKSRTTGLVAALDARAILAFTNSAGLE